MVLSLFAPLIATPQQLSAPVKQLNANCGSVQTAATTMSGGHRSLCPMADGFGIK
jgi:hypothetical protein